MIILIPLGGTGERFKANGYTKPKALIPIFGKPILFYLIDNLNLTNIQYIYIPYNKEYSKYNFESLLIHTYPNINFKFKELQTNTEGASETINIALKEITIDEDMPILCLDGDNFYTKDIVNMWNGNNMIFCFNDENESPIYSYIESNKNNEIIDIIEKNKISNIACCGAYGFSSYKKLLEYTQFIIDNNITQKGEYYTSTVIREMIRNNISFKYSLIDLDNYHCVGTPYQLKYFYINNLNLNNLKIKKQRICFDLDNTLVSYPTIPSDYSSVMPIQNNINLLKYIKSLGHTIIIYTARRMKTHSGNNGKILADIGKITFDTLDKFNIPYDEIYFGKPYADYYIDDLAINSFLDLNKELGFYIDDIKPRDNNSLEVENIEIYKKKSNDLSGEIYYYKNIPSSIKNLFPLLIDYDINNTWYKMEKIKGITFTTLYLNELLTKQQLNLLMNSIHKLHTTNIKNNEEINIYENYSNKVKLRYNNYHYSNFKNSQKIFNELINELEVYEKNNLGKCVIIHGDPVMTNIFIDNKNNIKFIDMRGKLGNKLTIYGDFLYDWAKLYQSLIGYDKILMNKKISENYEKELVDEFKKYFINLYSEEYFNYLKIITKSLLFSLIPIHNNNKCIEYYNLINSNYL